MRPCTLFWPRSGCRPWPGRPTCPVTAASAMRQRALSVPWVLCEIPMPQKRIPASAPGVDAGHGAKGGGVDAAHRGHRLRGERLDVAAQVLETLGPGRHVPPVVELLGDDDVEERVQEGHVRAGTEPEYVPGVPGEAVLPRIHHDEGLRLAACLK